MEYEVLDDDFNSDFFESCDVKPEDLKDGDE